MLYLHFFYLFFLFISGRMHIDNLLYARRIEFFNVFILVKEGLGGGGVTNACRRMGTHSLSYRTD